MTKRERRRQGLRDLVSLTTYSTTHFVVDFVCVFLLFRLSAIKAIADADVVPLFLLYNCLAFGLECAVGWFFDARTAKRSALIGCALLVAALGVGDCIVASTHGSDLALLRSQSGAAGVENGAFALSRVRLFACIAVALAGIGNAFFHTGGGIDALSRNIGKYWRSGVFIAPGALGVVYGMLCGMAPDAFVSFKHLMILVAAFVVAIWCLTPLPSAAIELPSEPNDANSREPRNVRVATSNSYARAFGTGGSFAALALALVVVFVRSGAGFIAPDFFTERSGVSLNPEQLAFCAFLGKFVGGFIADLFGAKSSGTILLLATIPLLCLSDSPSFFLLGVFLLNTTTAVTLVSSARACSGRVGFAFGLTTVALLIGFFINEPVLAILDGEDGVRRTAILLASMLAIATGALYFSTSKRAAPRDDEQSLSQRS